MTLKGLKVVTSVIVCLCAVAFFLIKGIATLVRDLTAQTAAATPGTVDALKAHGKDVASKAPSIAAKADEDLRKLLKIKAKAAPQVVASAANN